MHLSELLEWYTNRIAEASKEYPSGSPLVDALRLVRVAYLALMRTALEIAVKYGNAELANDLIELAQDIAVRYLDTLHAPGVANVQ